MTALPPKTALRWPEAVVFDLDGTLVDSALSIQLALNGALAEAGYGPLDIGTVKTMIGAGPEVLVQRALTALSGNNDTKFKSPAFDKLLADAEKAVKKHGSQAAKDDED